MSDRRDREDPAKISETRIVGGEGTLEAFEKLLAKPDMPAYLFRLYICGTGSRSALAIANIRRFCDRNLSGRYELQVIDVYQQPEEAKLAEVIAIPTLIKELPLPRKRFVGDMSDADALAAVLRLQA